MSINDRPRATEELRSGYAFAAVLAEQRRSRVAAWGDHTQAAIWAGVAQYCHGMSVARAVDDDQFRFQRDRERYRQELPMAVEEMDARGIFTIGGADGSFRSPWKQDVFDEVLELAFGYLSPMQRVCFELVVGGLLTVKEVAASLESDPREIRNHVARARRRIRKDVTPRVQKIAALLRRSER